MWILWSLLFGLQILPIANAEPFNTETDINQHIQRLNQNAHFKIPTLSAAQITELKMGDVVTIIDSSGGTTEPRRAMGFMLSTVPQQQLWVACQDPHVVLQSSTKEIQLETDENFVALWYGIFDMPWPFSDRHWLVKSWNTTALATQSHNQYWEHVWDLVPNGDQLIRPTIEAGKLPGISVEMIDAAIYTPVTRGAWDILHLDAETRLVVYHATTIIGGSIPEDMAVRFTIMTLSDMMKDMEKRAIEWVPKHYIAGHSGVLGGDNQFVPTF